MSDLAARVRAARAAAHSAPVPPDGIETPNAEAALDVLRDSFWPAVEVYIDARTEGVRLEPAEQATLDDAVEAALATYAAHYGYEIDPTVPVREAAETFLDTHDLRDTAQLLTGVPSRD
ncbi:MAG: hypothetical protein ABEJ35_00890 [Halobacteriaceae archaeon]